MYLQETRQSRLARVCAALLLGLLLSSCGGDPAPPSTPTPTPATPTSPAPVTKELAITGIPAALQIGQTAQLRAIARADDGGYVEVTAQARWASSNEAVCQVSAAGVAESRSGGTATITASYAGVTGSGSLSCGYVITATVHENAPTEGTRLQEVSVEADGGPFSGRTFTTDAQGRVSLPVVGQAGFALYFKKHGYDDLRMEIFELPRQLTLDVALMPVPDVRMEWGGACDGKEVLELFKTRREGRIRISATAVGLQSWQLVCPQVWPLTAPSAVIYACAGGQSATTEVTERVVRPGEYRTVLSRPSSCPAGATWNAVIERPR